MTRPGAGWCVWAAIIISVEIKTSRIRWLASTGPGPGYDHWCWEHWNVRHVTFSGTFYSNESHILIHKISGQNKYLTLNCQWKIITGVLLQLLENIINEWPLRLTGTSRVFSESNSVSDTTFEMCGQLFSNWMTEEKESTDDQYINYITNSNTAFESNIAFKLPSWSFLLASFKHLMIWILNIIEEENE